MRALAAFAFCSLLVSAPPVFAQATPKQRIKTIKDLTKKDGSAAIPELAGFLKDPDDEVRREAVKAVVQLGTQHSLAPLIESTKDQDEEIQIRAVEGLVNFYYPGYVEKGFTGSIKRVGKGIKGKFTDTNDQIIEAYIDVRDDVLAAIARLVKEGGSTTVKASAARACGVLRSKPSIPILLEAVKSKDSQVLYESLIAIQKIRQPETAPGIAFLLQDLNERVQLAAIETTGLLLNKKALPDLNEALKRAKNNKVRAAAITAMAMLPDESSRPVFEQYVEDRDESLRAAAAEGFARLKNKADLERMVKLFEAEGKMKPRLSLAFAASSLGKREMTEFSPLQYLVNTLNSSGYHDVAAAFLRELIREKSTREALYPVINQRTKSEKIELANIFAREGDQETIPVLESLTRDGDVDVGQAAAKALRNLKSRMP
jgi:HEAT repeat protein